ncbi:MAG: hypothetical protein SNJ56_01885 [Termitinemataceae bacterium]
MLSIITDYFNVGPIVPLPNRYTSDSHNGRAAHIIMDSPFLLPTLPAAMLDKRAVLP